MGAGSTTRRAFLAGLGTAPIATAVRAEAAYPAGRTIKFVVPFSAGGTVDFVGRTVADRLGALWSVPTVVVNVAAAGGNLGIDRVAKGPADGSQILIVTPTVATAEFMTQHLAFDPARDIVPLAQVASLPNLLCVRNGLPVGSVAQLIAYAKAHPGTLNYGSSGVGTTLHLAGEMFKRMAGVDIVHVAYRGGAPVLNDLLGGSIDLAFPNIPTIIEQARAGAVRPLGVTMAQRSTFAPDIPAIAETLPGYDISSWSGVGVRAGTARAICDVIENGTRVICREPAVRERFATQVTETVGSTAAEFADFIASERRKWGQLIKQMRLRDP